jgi:hypothetical protein
VGVAQVGEHSKHEILIQTLVPPKKEGKNRKKEKDPA